MSESENPVIDSPEPKQGRPHTNQDWWPNQLDLSVLHQHSPAGNPLGADFDYKSTFAELDIEELTRDVKQVLNTSQDWWPADFGHYGGLMIRLSWHAAGTYRIEDGRGGAGDGSQRFAPLNSWPDNANLDKARRLLWPVKQKHGQKISWADLLVFAGNVALEDMGFETFGFGFGREDIWEPEEIFWGPEDTWLGDERYSGERDLAEKLGAVQMGLIYVNPEGPNGEPDPLKAAHDIRETFRRMAMNDEETVALIAGGHSFGKTHGAASGDYVGAEPEGCPVIGQGLGWPNTFGSGKGADAITSGIEVTWTSTPTQWSNGFFDNLFGHEWELEQSPAGAHQWVAKDAEATIPDAHGGRRTGSRPCSPPTSRCAWTRSTRRSRAGSTRTSTSSGWPSPRPGTSCSTATWVRSTATSVPWSPSRSCGRTRSRRTRARWSPTRTSPTLKAKLLESGLGVDQLVRTAWASAASFRDTDKRGGANGARIRLEPQKDWEVNEPTELATVLEKLEQVRTEFNGAGGAQVSLADLIVLAGSAAVEKAAKDAGHDVTVRFTPGRTDASQEQTDVESFAVLEPRADGFRNYLRAGEKLQPETLLLDKANLLRLSAPEMTVLVGGLRALGANVGGSQHGVLTDRAGSLTNDFFVNLLSPGTEWKASESAENVYEIRDLASGDVRWTATDVDLVFGSNSQLRAIAEVYGSADAEQKFVDDFVAAWVKVMEADRFDVQS